MTAVRSLRPRRLSLRTAIPVLLAFRPGTLYAHPGRALAPGEVWGAWTFDPWVLLVVGASLWVYARGVGRVWGRAGRGRGVSRRQFAAFAAGAGVLVLALVSPVHALGGALFSAHMLQHELLILVAAPLMAAGAPGVAAAWAVPGGWLPRYRRLAGGGVVRGIWRAASHPLGAWSLHAVALWLWHVPALYQATLESELVHVLQHVSFFASALLFWWVVLRHRRGAGGYGVAVLLLFTTMLHGNALGALLTFANAPWYPAYTESAARWGLSALQDQQIGGLVMWVPAGTIYIGVALFLLAAWLREPAPAPRPPDAAPARRGPG